MSYHLPTGRLPTAATRRAVSRRTLLGMYRYRCGQCATTSPSVRTRVELDRERDQHRRRVHGGHIPDGERMQRAVRHPTSDRIAIATLAALVAVLLLSMLASRLG